MVLSISSPGWTGFFRKTNTSISEPGSESPRGRDPNSTICTSRSATGLSGHRAMAIGEDFQPFHGHEHLCPLLQPQMSVSLLRHLRLHKRARWRDDFDFDDRPGGIDMGDRATKLRPTVGQMVDVQEVRAHVCDRG